MNFILIFFSLLLVLPVYGKSWTNLQGKAIEADFVRIEGEKVVLMMKDHEYKIPLSSLSEEDQAFAKEESERLVKKSKLEAKNFMGQELTAGKVHIFEFELSAKNKALTGKKVKGWGDSFSKSYPGQWVKDAAVTPDFDAIRVYLGVPDGFDPTKGCPIFVQWTSSDTKSHISGAQSYWDTCKKKGWMLVSVEGAPDQKSLWTNSVFYLGIREFFEQLHAKYPGSERWKVATGGFSGGAKICQWMGGLMNEIEGVEVSGYWIGGCNEAFVLYALDDFGLGKKEYRNAVAYISSGDKDDLVKPEHRERVEEGIKDFGFSEVRSELYEGGHSISQEQFAEALDWFLK